MPGLFDAHCHATGKMEAAPAGTGRRLVCGVAAGDWAIVADWALHWAGTVPAFGIHPWECGEDALAEGGWEEALAAWLLRFPAAWAGEIGLDGAKAGRVPMTRQIDVLARQLRLAARLGRGVNLHCVRAYDELLALLDAEYFAAGAGKCILHSFNGSERMIGEFVARGAYFSVGPLAARRDTPKIRARVALLPAERILLESDAFLAPGVDATEDLLFTLRWLAGVKGMDADVLSRCIAGNSRRILDGAE